MLKARWPEAEPAIAELLLSGSTDKTQALLYYQTFIKGGNVWSYTDADAWAQGVLAQHPKQAKTAAAHTRDGIVNGVTFEALARGGMMSRRLLAVTAQAPDMAWRYLTSVRESRWPEAEPALAKGGRADVYAATYLKDAPDADKVEFLRLTNLSGFDLVEVMQKARVSPKLQMPEDLTARMSRSLTGALEYATYFGLRVSPETESLVADRAEGVNEESVLGYIDKVIQGPWPAFEHYLIGVNVRNHVHAGIYAQRYITDDAVFKAVSSGAASFTPDFIESFLTDRYSQTWATYASNYESAPIGDREIADPAIVAARLAMSDYAPKPKLDPFIYAAWTYRDDRDAITRQHLVTYLRRNHPDCVTSSNGGWFTVGTNHLKRMSSLAAIEQGLGREDFERIYGPYKLSSYNFNGFFPGEPHVASRTASAQLSSGMIRGEVIAALRQNDMVKGGIKTAIQARPIVAFEAAWLQGRRWEEMEPAIFSIGGANSNLPLDYYNEVMDAPDIHDVAPYVHDYLQANVGVCPECGDLLSLQPYERDRWAPYCTAYCRNQALNAELDDEDMGFDWEHRQAKVAATHLKGCAMWGIREALEVIAQHGMGKGNNAALLKLNPYRLWQTVTHIGYQYGGDQSKTRLPWPEVEQIFIDQFHPETQDYALAYARKVLRGPWPEAEHLFARYSRDTYRYALECLHGRFEPGETQVAKDILKGGSWEARDARAYYIKFIDPKRPEPTWTPRSSGPGRSWPMPTRSPRRPRPRSSPSTHPAAMAPGTITRVGVRSSKP